MPQVEEVTDFPLTRFIEAHQVFESVIESQTEVISLVPQPSLPSPHLSLTTFVQVVLVYEDMASYGDVCALQAPYRSQHNVTFCAM